MRSEQLPRVFPSGMHRQRCDHQCLVQVPQVELGSQAVFSVLEVQCDALASLAEAHLVTDGAGLELPEVFYQLVLELVEVNRHRERNSRRTR
jgi:hypothetical protein